MWRFCTAVLTVLLIIRIGSTQESEVEVTLTRGTTGLGFHLVSETRGKGAVVERVVPESGASLVLRAGDVVTIIAGIEIRQWSLVNINLLLQTQDRLKLQIQRRVEAISEPQLRESRDIFQYRDGEEPLPKTSSCYASLEVEADDVHTFECTPAAFGGDLPTFSTEDPKHAFPVVIAQPLEYCTRSPRFNGGGHALLVSRGGCLPHVKAQNAERSGAEVLLVMDGQFPPFPPLPRTSGKRTLPIITSTHPSAQGIDISVLVIHNETGQRIVEEIMDNHREVVVFSHAGGRPSRSKVKPRNQLPLAEAESLQPAKHAFDLTSTFRDGRISLALGKPGLPAGEVLTMNLELTYQLSSILKGLTETVFFSRTVLCPVCHGRGAPEVNMRPCKSCSALGEKGISTISHDYSHEVKQTLRTTCPRCHGFGEVPKKGSTCSRCKGARIIHERASLHIRIPKGAPDPYTLKFQSIGSQLPGKTTGNVEVVAKAEPHEKFVRDGVNLRAGLNISLTEALSGFTRDFELLNGSAVFLNKTGMTNNKDEIELRGGGLPYYNGRDNTGGRNNNGEETPASRTAGASMDSSDEGTTTFGSVFVTCTVVFPQRLEHFWGNADSALVNFSE